MHTLGDVITVAIALAALIIVPYKIVKAWVSKPRVMSHSAQNAARTSYEPTEPIPVRWQQNQPEPAEPAQIEPGEEKPSLYRLTRQEEIAILAVQRNEDGSYRHSANAITTFVGGTAADVKRQIAEIRDPQLATPVEAQPQSHGKRLDRPANGWQH